MDQLLNSVGDTRGELKRAATTHKLAAMPESFTIRLQLAARHRDRGEHEELNASLAAAGKRNRPNVYQCYKNEGAFFGMKCVV